MSQIAYEINVVRDRVLALYIFTKRAKAKGQPVDLSKAFEMFPELLDHFISLDNIVEENGIDLSSE